MNREIAPCVYILASKRRGFLYVGVTSNVMQRIYQHRSGLFSGYTKENGVKSLVWFEMFETMEGAITREKQMKKWRRVWKIELIESQNLYWDDLAVMLGFASLTD